jgi:hypothetical protein
MDVIEAESGKWMWALLQTACNTPKGRGECKILLVGKTLLKVDSRYEDLRENSSADYRTYKTRIEGLVL